MPKKQCIRRISNQNLYHICVLRYSLRLLNYKLSYLAMYIFCVIIGKSLVIIISVLVISIFSTSVDTYETNNKVDLSLRIVVETDMIVRG